MQQIALTQETFKIPPVVYMVQNDERTLKMVIADIIYEDGDVGTLYFKRSDGSYYSVQAELDESDNSYTAVVTQALTQAGITECQLKVDSSVGYISTYTFYIDVQESVNSADDVVEQMGVTPQELIEAANQIIYASSNTKVALLQIAEKTAYIDANGQDYYDDLYNALYPPVRATSVSLNTNSLVFTSTNVTNTLTATVLPNNHEDTLEWGTSDPTVAVVADGEVTAVGDGSCTITATCGPVKATASVSVSSSGVTLTGITATYTQTALVFTDSDLNDLKADLVVVANYSDSSSATLSADDYTLSGTLSAGTSTITATYEGFTDAFSVTVSTRLWLYNHGDQCTAVTGGWESTKGFNTGSNKITFNDTKSLHILGTVAGTASWAQSYNTVNPIDFTGYTKIIVEREAFINISGSTTGTFWAYFPSTIANASTQSGAYGSDYSSKRVTFHAISSGTGNAYVEGAFERSIPDGVTSAYISFNLNVYTKYGIGSYARIKGVYLA